MMKWITHFSLRLVMFFFCRIVHALSRFGRVEPFLLHVVCSLICCGGRIWWLQWSLWFLVIVYMSMQGCCLAGSLTSIDEREGVLTRAWAFMWVSWIKTKTRFISARVDSHVKGVELMFHSMFCSWVFVAQSIFCKRWILITHCLRFFVWSDGLWEHVCI